MTNSSNYGERSSLHISREAFTDEKEPDEIEQHQKKKNARLPRTNGNTMGQTDIEQEKGEGKETACSLTLCTGGNAHRVPFGGGDVLRIA